MKPYYLLFLLVVCGLIFTTVKSESLNEFAMNGLGARQEQQEEALLADEISPDTFHIRMEIESENDEPVADILWFQEAAQIAMEKNIPWFNVIEQKLHAGSVEGVIQLERDPMKAEYDANEILSLHLTDEAVDY